MASSLNSAPERQASLSENEAIEKPPSYGVCDSVEQFASKYPHFEGIVNFTPVYREKQRAYGSWRWHKWGPYIGIHDIYDIEYLYEADGKEGRPLINEQWLFDLNSCQEVMGLDEAVTKHIKNGVVKSISKYAISINELLENKDRIEKLMTIDEATIRTIWAGREPWFQDHIIKKLKEESRNKFYLFNRLDYGNKSLLVGHFNLKASFVEKLVSFLGMTTHKFKNNETLFSMDRQSLEKVIDDYNGFLGST